MKKIVFETLPSTQTYVKENIEQTFDTFVVCKNQTNGRGRTGRKWISSCDNLMFSFGINCSNLKIENYPLITLLTGLAVRTSLSSITGDNNFLIKWPNDIVYNGKKVCGIIAEGMFKETGNYIVIGIGINVNQTSFDSTISNLATSLKLITNKEYNNDEILNQFDIVFNKLLKELEQDNKSFIKKINVYNYLKNKEVNINNDQYKNETFECVKINTNGCLVLKTFEGKEFEINSNEVTLHNNY